jgi:hypothetical protein
MNYEEINDSEDINRFLDDYPEQLKCAIDPLYLKKFENL